MLALCCGNGFVLSHATEWTIGSPVTTQAEIRVDIRDEVRATSRRINRQVDRLETIGLRHHAVLTEDILSQTIMHAWITHPAARFAVGQIHEDLKLSIQAEGSIVGHLHTERNIFVDLRQ